MIEDFVLCLDGTLLRVVGKLGNMDMDIVGERSNFKKNPTHTQDHGDA